ncbi:MAG: RES family NAD+ phosphorylase [Gemmatimonadales bacterium]
MRTAWRICKTRHASNAFDGEGARLNGGRWNSTGVRVPYASESVALAALEVLAGVQKTAILAFYSLTSITFDEACIEVVPASSLPGNWRNYPASPGTQAIGDRWVAERRSLVLRVPSAIIEAESNFLINPAHPGFGSVEISTPVPFELDLGLLPPHPPNPSQ